MNAFAQQFASVIWVTLLYIGLYYAFLIQGLRAKTRVMKACKAAGEPFLRYSKQYPELLATDRVQLNTLEHMPPFLVLLWLQALIVSVPSATLLGGIYVGIRATYPIFMGPKIHRGFPKRLLINTFSGYTVLAVMAVWQVRTLLL